MTGVQTCALPIWVILFSKMKKGNLPPALIVPDAQTLLDNADAMAPQAKAAAPTCEIKDEKTDSQPLSDDIIAEDSEEPLLSDEYNATTADEQADDADNQEPTQQN